MSEEGGVIAGIVRVLVLGCMLWMPAVAGGDPVQEDDPLRRPAAPHYDVVALRVEFQPDTTRLTTGTGTFAGPLFEEGLEPTVDPLPHDAAYFQAHLSFLEHYVQAVSNGRTTVTTHLVPEVVQVSQRMAAYSPMGPQADEDAEMGKLAALVDEAWTLADAQSRFDGTGLDPERTVFVLFHAGVGRDIELIGTTLDKTPQDLPSRFFDEEALHRLQPGRQVRFKGMPVRHTLLLPRTETRQGFDFIADEPFLAEFSMNGLMVASFLNALGVPDVLDVGPFGLMEPLGWFAFNGLFPPEPSAWTRYFLGWTDPVELRGDGPETVHLEAVGKTEGPDLARAWMSEGEYFLVENRYQQSTSSELVLQVWQDGTVVEQRVDPTSETFNRHRIDDFVGGVVVGVSDYDGAVPGSVDDDGTEYRGGILVWHVDERRLLQEIGSGVVNEDRERRAVDLEEADGAQDLGYPSNSPFGPQAETGTPFDFFFEGNPTTVVTSSGREIRLYENRFGSDTTPGSATNEGGPSFVTLRDFSAPGPTMSFVYERGAEQGILPAGTGHLQSLEPFATVEAASLSPAGDDAVTVHDGHGRLGVAGTTGEAFEVTDDVVVSPIARDDGSVTAVHFDASGTGTLTRIVDGDVVEAKEFPPPFPSIDASSRLFEDAGTGERYVWLSSTAETGLFRLIEAGGDEVELRPVTVDGVGRPVTAAVAGRGALLIAGRQGAATTDGARRWSYAVPDGADVGQAVAGHDAAGRVGVVPVPGRSELLILRADETVHRVNVAATVGLTDAASVRLSPRPVLVDVDADGRLDVLATFGKNLVAYTQQGAVVDGFPLRLNAPAVAQPLIAELSESGGWSVIVAGRDGYLYAYDLGAGGTAVPGFPLAVGRSVVATPLLHGRTLMAVSEEGRFAAWELDAVGTIWWGTLYGDARNQSYVEVEAPPDGESPETDRLLVAAETYNWPNPIREGVTNLRCMTTEAARVDVVITDAAGDVVDEIDMGTIAGGTPAEHRWETSAASGLYFARVRARTADGETETRLVKMAIIR